MITGKTLRDSIISGANLLISKKSSVDELNVFPVPDGDTGTNMSMTMRAAARELAILPDGLGVGEVAGKAASACFLLPRCRCAASLLRGLPLQR